MVEMICAGADLVEDLKSQEREYYKDLLAGAGVEPSEKNVEN